MNSPIAMAAPHAAAGKRYWRAASKILPVESIIALAIAVTVLAVAYREPLTEQEINFGPQQQNHSFYSYTYDDRGEGGKSSAESDPRKPLAYSCQIRPGFGWPYCAFGITFDTNGAKTGLDLSKFDLVKLTVSYRGSAKLVRLDLRNHDPRYEKLERVVDQADEADFPIHSGPQTVSLAFDDFAVAGWWKDQTKAPPELARPTFRNVLSMEIITGLDSRPGEQWFQVEQIKFERHWISPAGWYGAIALCWMVLISSLLLYRRRQIDQLKASAEKALRKRERLHRTILETSTDCIILFGADGCVEFANGRSLSAFGMGALVDVEGKHWSEIWTGGGLDIATDTLSRAAAGETVRMRYQGSSDPPKWWDVVVTPMSDDDGTVRGMLSISRDVTAELEHTNQLKWASEHDALTHLPNRRAFQARLQAATLRAMETGEQIGLLLIDLDHFKHVNDALGHSAGDELLKIVAERLRAGVRNDDFVARIGGDEFAIILEHVASEKTLMSVGDLVVSLIQAPLRAGDRAVAAGASIGGALFPENAITANDLFKHADTALYALKQSGRGGTRLFDSYMLVEAEKNRHSAASGAWCGERKVGCSGIPAEVRSRQRRRRWIRSLAPLARSPSWSSTSGNARGGVQRL